MAQEYIIGREGTQPLSLADKKTVSRRHLKAVMHSQNEWDIEDLGSANGTFVNGLPVSTSRVTLTTPIILGTFETTLAKLLNINASKSGPTPATNHVSTPGPTPNQPAQVSVGHLKDVYEGYRQSIVGMAKRRSRAQLYRMLPMSLGIPLVVGLSGMFLPADNNGTLIKGVLMASFMGLGTALTLRMIPQGDQLAEEQFDVNRRFQIDYVCPKCKNFLGMNKPYEALLTQGQCPYCKAKFHE